LKHLLCCPLGNSLACPTEIGKLVNALIQADRAINIETYCIGLAQGLNNLWKQQASSKPRNITTS
jgi:hypothetical protein